MAGVEALTSCLDLLTLLIRRFIFTSCLHNGRDFVCLLSGHNSLKKCISRKNEIAGSWNDFDQIHIILSFDF